MVPEIAIPSADAHAPLSRVCRTAKVLWPESFRGGCSFGTSKLVLPMLWVELGEIYAQKSRMYATGCEEIYLNGK